RRAIGTFPTRRSSDLAMLRLAEAARRLTGADTLCLAGGVALNCVSNGKLQKAGIFNDIFIQPAAGDAGGALGAALAAYHIYFGKERIINWAPDAMQGSYLGPVFTDLEVKLTARKYKAAYTYYEDFAQLCAD